MKRATKTPARRSAPNLTKRMAIRTRPEGPPLLHQTWDKLLFLHWQVPVEAMRPLIPPCLSIDTHHGSAWVGVTPFTIRDSRPSFTPPLPWLSSFHEVNVRTYVHRDGVPGVWFFSLDANSPVAVMAAHTFFRLPYFHADIVHENEGRKTHCRMVRSQRPAAELTATWNARAATRKAEQGSLEFFWIERYCLYTASDDTLYRARIFHEPWPIRDVDVAEHRSTVLEAAGLPSANGKARLLDAGPVKAEIWPLEEIGTF